MCSWEAGLCRQKNKDFGIRPKFESGITVIWEACWSPQSLNFLIFKMQETYLPCRITIKIKEECEHYHWYLWFILGSPSVCVCVHSHACVILVPPSLCVCVCVYIHTRVILVPHLCVCSHACVILVPPCVCVCVCVHSHAYVKLYHLRGGSKEVTIGRQVFTIYISM